MGGRCARHGLMVGALSIRGAVFVMCEEIEKLRPEVLVLILFDCNWHKKRYAGCSLFIGVGPDAQI